MKKFKQKVHNEAVIHFMGIGGSGLSAVAAIAHQMRFVVTGCDLLQETPYLKKIKDLGIEVFVGHDQKHLEGVEVLAVTPAAYFQQTNHPEFVAAKKSGILMTGPEFMGKFLQRGKTVISIAGTHGKSTTTAMAGLVFAAAGQDPTVVIGAKVPVWGANYRIGSSDLFIVEADEFFESFLAYRPEIIVLNNIEFDHPDYFRNEKAVLASFARHVKSLRGQKVLIYNKDSQGVKKLFGLLGEKFLSSITTIGYSPQKETIPLKVPGKHNVANALGVVALARVFDLDEKIVRQTLVSFSGIARRLELIGEKRGVVVYDDYAHHPTAIAATLAALREVHPRARVVAIVEPHTFSRTKALLPLYKDAFAAADEVIIAPIFRSRDSETFGISQESIVKVANHQKISAMPDFAKISAHVGDNAKKGDIILVMGAGESYKLARQIYEDL